MACPVGAGGGWVGYPRFLYTPSFYPLAPHCGEGVGRVVSRLRLRTVLLLASGEGEQAQGKDEAGGDPGAGFGNLADV